jgi:hypothetical protein
MRNCLRVVLDGVQIIIRYIKRWMYWNNGEQGPMTLLDPYHNQLETRKGTEQQWATRTMGGKNSGQERWETRTIGDKNSGLQQGRVGGKNNGTQEQWATTVGE